MPKGVGCTFSSKYLSRKLMFLTSFLNVLNFEKVFSFLFGSSNISKIFPKFNILCFENWQTGSKISTLYIKVSVAFRDVLKSKKKRDIFKEEYTGKKKLKNLISWGDILRIKMHQTPIKLTLRRRIRNLRDQ